jgi:hypothetical protein
MQGQYHHGEAYYRCRFPQEYALANQVPHPRNVYLREDALTDPLDTWLASAYDVVQVAQTSGLELPALTADVSPEAGIGDCGRCPFRARLSAARGTAVSLVGGVRAGR